jgi:hypothetical protein
MSSARQPVLLSIGEKLISEFPGASIRGEDTASFVYAQHDQKAVELSMLDEQRIWVEFWDHALGEDSPPVKDQTYITEDDAMAAVQQWLYKGTMQNGR